MAITNTPVSFQNFPARYDWSVDRYDFLRQEEIGQFDWNCVGHTAPLAVNGVDGGSITLGSGSANAQDYVQMQKSSFTLQPNRAGKLYEFIWDGIGLSDKANTSALLGVCVPQTNLMGANLVNGVGFYCNQNGGPGTGNWYAFVANNASAQFSGYSQQLLLPTDANTHTMSIRWQTDQNLIGGGTLTWFIDGVDVYQLSSSGAAIFPVANVMSLSAAMGNLTGAAQTLIMDEISSLGQR